MVVQDKKPKSLLDLKNVGAAAMRDFSVLGITTLSQLAKQNADNLYVRLCQKTRQTHDPCVHDVFSAAIHQAKTGISKNWWFYTPSRKKRQELGTFPKVTSR